METALYIDKGNPLIRLWPENLSDGSVVWSICFRGGMSIDFESEKKAREAFQMMAAAIQTSMAHVVII